MLKAIVIDDEKDAIDFLCGAIDRYCPDARVVGFSTNIDDGLREIELKNPDIVFLDIAMPSGNGFELLNRIPDRNFEVIFITAYNEHAIQAFRYSAIDYLLKPVDISELVTAVNKVAKSVSRTNLNVVNVLLDNLRSGSPSKLSLPTTTGYEYVLLEDIIRIEADRSYCCFYLTQRRKYLVSRCLNDYHQLLENNSFFRIHNSHLINMRHVKSYLRRDGGYVEMTDSSQIPISRTKKDFFLNAMRQHVV
jgi:two-component system, LytTR family, response regulator